MRLLLIAATALTLAACENATLGAGMRITPDGVKVVPTVSARQGGASVVVRP